MKEKNRKTIIILLIIIIIILLYFLICNFGNINHHDVLTPTGNVDIFDITCDCSKCNNSDNKSDSKTDTNTKTDTDSKEVFNEDDDSQNTDNKTEDNNNESKSDEEEKIEDLYVKDDYQVWANEELRIFTNQAYEYVNDSTIAPGTSNSYVYVVRNNNDFDVVVDMTMIEENPYGVNMKYKLRTKDGYLAGSDTEYVDLSELEQKNIVLKAKQSIAYTLDWKWVDSDNDTQIGETIGSYYKLSINVGANQE